MPSIFCRHARKGIYTVTLSALAMALAGGTAYAKTSVEERAIALHKKIIVIDSHTDVPDDFGSGQHEFGIDGDTQVDLPKLKRGGFGAIVLASFAHQGPTTADKIAEARSVTDAKLKAILAAGPAHSKDAALALTASDIRKIHASGRVAILPGFLNAYPFGDTIEPIDDYVRQGVRIFGLVHAGNNAFADSSRPSGEPKEAFGGLSPLGKRAIARLNDLGVLIDVSQLSSAGLQQVLSLSRAPVIASHSGLKAIVDVPRNLSDDELAAIKANGGVVQIVAFKGFLVPNPPDYDDRVRALRIQYGLSPDYKTPNEGAAALGPEKAGQYGSAVNSIRRPVTVADLVDSIEYAVKRIGVDHIGISSDFNHGGGVIGWNNEAEAHNVTAELLRRGYSPTQIGKLWGGNFLRVLEAARKAKS